MTWCNFEDFEIGDVIGMGTVGTVYHAKDCVTNQDVALKVLLPIVSRDSDVAARFSREMQILERLHHPNIVQYYGDGKSQGQLFFVMEHIDGGSLKDIIEQTGRLTWQAAVECGWQICSALQYAHNHGIVHRDLKPSNLLITRQGALKLVDWGIALDTGAVDITATGMTVGSHLYMAPEQIRGERSTTGQTDLYSLGCVLYELLTGSVPFVADNFAKIFDQHLNGVPVPISERVDDCPAELEAVVMQLLEKDPYQRPLNARTVQGVLADVRLQHGTPGDSFAGSALEGKVQAMHTSDGKFSGSPILNELVEQTLGEGGSATDDVSWSAILVILVVLSGVLGVLSYFQS